MKIISKRTVLAGLGRAAKKLCPEYSHEPRSPKHHGKCKCQFNDTGCPEVRLAGYVLEKMEPGEFKEILGR